MTRSHLPARLPTPPREAFSVSSPEWCPACERVAVPVTVNAERVCSFITCHLPGTLPWTGTYVPGKRYRHGPALSS